MNEIQKVERSVMEELLRRTALTLGNAETRGAYLRDVVQYIKHVHGTGEALAEGLASWKAALKAVGLSMASVNRKLSGVKTILRRAADSQGPQVRRGVEASISTVKGVRQAHGAIRPEKLGSPQKTDFKAR
jgi:hypothetical protein